MKLKTFETVTFYTVRYKVGYSLLVGLGIFLSVFKLGSLVPGLSEAEVISAQTSTPQAILDNPIFAPYRILQYLLLDIVPNTTWAIRLPSVIFGGAMVFGIYLFMRSLYSERVAILGSMLVAISSFYLSYSRWGTPAIATAWAIAALLGVSAWIMRSERIGWWKILNGSLVVSLALFMPLGWLWITLLLLLHPRQLRDITRDAGALKCFFACLVVACSVGLIAYAASKDLQILKDFAFWPNSIPAPLTYLGNVLRVVVAPFWRDTLIDPVVHLSNLPLLDIFASAMVILGILTLIFKPTLARTRILSALGLGIILIIALNPTSMTMVMLLPALGVIGAIGIDRLLQEWYRMFPRNPFARIGALIPLTLVILLASYYHVHRSFVAWPRNLETKEVFSKTYNP